MKKEHLLLFILIVGLLTACSKAPEEAPPAISESEEKKEEKEVYDNTYPFTGIETNEDVTNRVLAVMINNHKKARPQSGLTEADVVFEFLTEGDITRFLAMYHSTIPDIIGPVRSAREYFFTTADNYDAVYVYHGAANFINDMIISRGIEHISGARYDNDHVHFVRESFRKAPHNSYFLTEHAYDTIAENGYDTQFTYEPLLFTDEVEATNTEGMYVKINYSSKSNVSYEYDETKEKYFRYNDGEQTVELASEEPVLLDNIFIIETEHRVIDEEQRRFIDIESGGNAYLLQRGHMQSLQWENRDGRIVPVKDGEIAPFVPGKTWINVVPLGAEQSVTERIQFSNE